MCSWIASYTGQAIKERLQDENGSSWLHYASKMREKCVQIELPRNYGAQLNQEKEVQETWNRALNSEFRTSRWDGFKVRSPTEDQHHVWVSSTSRHPKRTGMKSRASRRRLQEVGWGGLHVQRETKWTPGEDWVKHIQRELRRVSEGIQIVTNREPFLVGVFESRLFDSLLSAISHEMI